jgi:hypothetical protein
LRREQEEPAVELRRDQDPERGQRAVSTSAARERILPHLLRRRVVERLPRAETAGLPLRFHAHGQQRAPELQAAHAKRHQPRPEWLIRDDLE